MSDRELRRGTAEATTGATTDDGRRSDRRDRLVDAGMALFRRRGTGGAGVAAVCAAGGVTKGVFSHHFPGGKDELVAAVVRRNADEVDALVGRALDAAPTLGAAVATCFGAYADLLDRDPDLGCPIAAAVVDGHETSPAVRAVADAAFRRWEDRLAHALRERAVDPATAATLATTVVAAMEGAILLALARREPGVLRATGAVVAEAVDRAAAGDHG